MTAPVKPYLLPRLDAANVHLANVLSVRDLPQAIYVGETPMTLRLVTTPPAFTPAFLCDIEVNGANWQVSLDTDECLKLHPFFGDDAMADEEPVALPLELKEALAETLLRPVLASLSKAIVTSVTFENVAFGARAVTPAAAGFQLTGELPSGAPLILNAGLHPAEHGAAEALSALLSPLARHNNGFLAEVAGDIPVTLSFDGADLVLTKDEATALTEGDVLLPDQWLPREESLIIRLLSAGTALEAKASLSGREATLLSPLAPMENPDAMSETESINVRLTFQLEERTLTVADLQNLQPGYVFTLAADPAAPVTVLANGRPVAHGRLVDVNGAVGVQLTDSIHA